MAAGGGCTPSGIVVPRDAVLPPAVMFCEEVVLPVFDESEFLDVLELDPVLPDEVLGLPELLELLDVAAPLELPLPDDPVADVLP